MVRPRGDAELIALAFLAAFRRRPGGDEEAESSSAAHAAVRCSSPSCAFRRRGAGRRREPEGQAEQWKDGLGVQKEADPGDAIAGDLQDVERPRLVAAFPSGLVLS